MRLVKKGDTLVEVLIAFSILATIIGFSFTASLSGYKTALAAQNRTQAQLVAQYEADGLKTYRDSLAWSSDQGPISFLGGGTDPALVPSMQTFIDNGQSFCINIDPSTPSATPPFWKIKSEADCNNLVTSLAPNLNEPELSIKLTQISGNPNVFAEITVSWQPRNANVREQVVNTVILTEQQ